MSDHDPNDPGHPGDDLSHALAVVGYACRFPGARDAEAFWHNLRQGIASVSRFSEEEVLAAGADPAAVRRERYVRAAAVLEDEDRFDAGLFGFTPREARLLDPQHRHFFECGWAALEHAGIDPAQSDGAIGVFAGSFLNGYLLGHLAPRPEVLEEAGWLSTRILNDKDFLATRLSYLLDLRGPSLTVQTACSTSLVATHLASQALLSYECDVALAGGVAIQIPQRLGYLYEEGGIFSPDGVCRPFDARGQGTVGGSGVGLVVLKRLEDALADGDVIHALVRGSAINNDGALKAGYTAPSVESQAEVVAAAQSLADLDPETITYIEAHGTGTSLGDPIEVEALTQVFRARTDRRGFCALGSVKSNIGHLDAAAGVAGLIKTVLALEHGELPPSLHCEQPNPAIGFEATPFRVHTELSPWPRGETPRRAGVSSFGVGGTNAHVVLEEAPVRGESGPSRPWQLLPLSAATPAALERRARDLAEHLESHPQLALADVAHTLQAGRRALRHRRTVLARDLDEAVRLLSAGDPGGANTAEAHRERPPVAFLIPGQGAQRAAMGAALYRQEPTYRAAVDRCAEILEPHLPSGGEKDLRTLLFDDGEEAAATLRHTAWAQPALFVTAWAIAQLWAEWGVEPRALVGHSLGELVAAALAGVLSLEDALEVVAARGRLMGEQPGGAMLSVSLDAETVGALLAEEAGDELALAAVNAEELCAVSGPEEAIARLERHIAARGIECRRLVTSHAFHSAAMDPVLEPLGEILRRVQLHPPARPVVSSLTGRFLTNEEATSPEYWLAQTRRTVRFADALTTLVEGQEDLLVLEVGPGRALSGLARRRGVTAFASLDPAREDELCSLLEALGGLWRRGVKVDWRAFTGHEERRREVLPTYPFADTRFWIDRPAGRAGAGDAGSALAGFEALDLDELEELGSRADKRIAVVSAALPAALSAASADADGASESNGQELGIPVTVPAVVFEDGEALGQALGAALRDAEAVDIVAWPLPDLVGVKPSGDDPLADLGVLHRRLQALSTAAGALHRRPRLVVLAPEPSGSSPDKARDEHLALARHHTLVTWAQSHSSGDSSGDTGAGSERRYAVIEQRGSGTPPSSALLAGACLAESAGALVVARAPRPSILSAPPEGSDAEPAGAAGEAPQGPMEERIAALWSRLLGVPVTDRHGDFFALGGHSLLATQAASRLRDELRVSLELEDLFRHPTPAALAAFLETRTETRAAETPATAPQDPEPEDTSPAPLSFAQRRFWLLDRLNPGNPAYNIPAAVRLRGRLSIPALDAALARLVERHPMLRTAFGEEDGEPFQQVLPRLAAAEHPALRHIDLRRLAPADREAELERTMNAHARRPFDLARLPLLRVALVRLATGDGGTGDDGGEARRVLLLNLHHLVGDGWSMALIVRDLGELYGAAVDGREPRLPALELRYDDHARANNRWLASAASEEQEAYWRSALDGELPTLDLPADRPRRAPGAGGQTGGRPSAHLHQVLPAEAVATLLERGRERGATPFMSLSALLALLFHRLSGLDEVVLGTPIAGRREQNLENVVGLFLNTLALRIQAAGPSVDDPTSGDPTFGDLLEHVRDVARGAFAHQEIPFERVLDQLPVERDLTRTPVFQVLFNLLSYPLETIRRPELEIDPLPPRDVGAKFDLTVYAREEPANGCTTYRLDWIYDSDLFDGRRIEMMMEQLEHLLLQIAANPEVPLAAVDLNTPGTAEVLPDPTRPLPADESLVPVPVTLRRRAAEHPEAEAVIQGDTSWTYGELLRAVDAIGNALRGLGLQPGERVAVSGPPSPALVAALAAVLETGMVLVPMDPAVATERARAMLEVAEARALLWTGAEAVPEALRGEVPAGEGAGGEDLDRPLTVLTLDPQGMPPADAPQLPGPSLEELLGSCADPAAPRDAYIFFTSGSTGRPKAILGNHHGLAHFLEWQRRTFDIGPGDRVAQLTVLTFDPVLRDVFLPLVSGGAVVLPEPADRVSGAALWRWMERQRITRSQAVPSLLDGWLEDVPLEVGPREVELAALKTHFSMGEALTGELVERFRSSFPGFRQGQVINLYGPTETTMVKCWYPVPQPAPPGVQSLGQPLPQTQVLVVRPGSGSPALAGIGEPGEIYLRTPYRSSGYLDAPESDRRRFMPNPWRDDAEDLLFRTGDRGRYDLDGSLTFLGRLDQQIKIRGVRIEPAEVRQALLALPGVAQGTIATFPDAQGRPRLVAYVVPGGDAEGREPGALTPAHLRAALVRKLPPAAVPESFVILDGLPRTHSGKIDHRRLPEPPPPAPRSSRRPPETAHQQLLADLWDELLEDGPFGLDDDFFAHGGNSLAVVQLAARLSTRHGLELPLRTVFENPTLEELAAVLDAAAGGGRRERDERSIPPARAEDGEYPLSYAQLRLWFLDQLNPGLTAYNIPTAWRLRGTLDADLLSRALVTVAARQEALRTGFHSPGGRAVQTVAPAVQVPLPLDDLSELPEDSREPELRRRLREEGAAAFDLSQPPLLRARLLRLGPEDHVLALTLHHIVSDAWSVGVLLGELAEAYAALRDGRAPDLPELPVRYVDFAAWQRGWLEGEGPDGQAKPWQGQLEFWRRQLAGAPAVLALPTDRPRPPVQLLDGARLPFRIPRRRLAGIEAVARNAGATAFAPLLAIFQALLQRISGQRDLVVGTPVANRPLPELEPLIGLFLNTVSLRAHDPAEDSLATATAAAHATALAAFEHQDLPFERLVDELEVPRDPSHSPVFQVLFTLHNTPLPRISLEELELGPYPLTGHGAKLDLTLDLRWGDDFLEGSLEYATALFDATTAARLVERFQRLLEGALARPSAPLAELDLLAPAERFQVLSAWNDTAMPIPEEALTERLARRAAERGETTALVFGERVFGERVSENRRWSYRRLHHAVELQARRLAAAGARPEGPPVAVLLERSPELLLALLAVLRCGASYVPLDPAYPAARLRLMVEDCGADRLLTAPRHRALADELLTELPEIRRIDLAGDGLDSDQAPESAESVQSALPGPDAADRAYVIYTSGSTGRPKGVEVHHGAMVNFLNSMAAEPGLEAEDRLLALTSPSFDISVLELFLPLWVGASVEIADAALASDAIALGRHLDGGRITVAQATPSTWRMLVDVGWRPRPDLKVLTGGEALPRDLAAALRSGGGPVWNLYGPTETTVWSAAAAVDGAAVTLGRPIANTEIYVLDPHRRPVGVGTPGEAWIGGAGVARGYLHRPALTAQRFVPDPFSGRPGARLYRVGDLVRWRSDGELLYLGRTDHQVKVRGFRIELGEIEAVLGQHPDLREVVVHALPAGGGSAGGDHPGGGSHRLAAYVVPAVEHEPLRVELLRSWLGERLPGHMVPALFLPLEELPRTPNGKIDRGALPAPEGERPDLEHPYVAPEGDAEEHLARIWSRLLGIEQVGALDNFFALGGDSILAVQVAFQTREAGLEMTTAQIFQHQSLRELAAALRPLEEAPEASQSETMEDSDEDLDDFGWSRSEGDAILEKL
ncbi:MAG: amino acid adenylation domain-containing protein [Acidobacteriota bacterium]|nr:amino acid adenylation domain-containing protein [Acidobacteriota bacterium]